MTSCSHPLREQYQYRGGWVKCHACGEWVAEGVVITILDAGIADEDYASMLLRVPPGIYGTPVA